MAAGSIVVSLLMSTGSFETDTARATKSAEKRFKELERSVSDAGKVIGATFAAVGVAAIAFGRNIVNGLDALNDVADATGASVENLSALEDVALRTGTNMDNVSSILVKFNNALKEADGKNGVSLALKAIGLEAEALKKLDPAEALRQTAVALSKFADDGDKARLIQELFGKSIKEAAPFLKDLAEQGKLNATVTSQQAEEAEKFNKQLFNLQANAIGLGRAIVGSVLPALNAFLENYRELARLGSFDLVLKDAAKGFFGAQSDITGDLSENINKLIAEREKLKTATAPDPDFAEAFKAQTENRIDEIGRLLTLLQQRQGRAQALLAGSGPEKRPAVGPLPIALPKGPKGPDPDADFKSYLKNLENQIQKTKDLSTVEKVLDDIRRGSLTVTDTQKAQLLGLAAIIDKEKELTEELKLKRDVAISAGEAITKQNEAYQADLNRLLSATPTAQLEESRKDIKLLTDEFQRFIDTAGVSGISEEQYLEAVSARLNLLKDGLQETDDFAKSLGLTFSSAFEDAIAGGKGLRDVLAGLEQDLFRLITRKLVTEPLANLFGDVFGDIFKKSSGGSSGISGLGGIFAGLFGGGAATSSAGLGLDSIFGGFFAEGGAPPMGKVSVVGENGPELFIPNTAGRIIPNDMLSKQASNNPTYNSINVNVTATPGMSRDTALQQGMAYGTGIQRALNRNGV